MWTMAWRNLWRNGRRTVVTVGAMTLALLAMVLWSSMIEGYLRQLERNILDIELGDIQVFAAGYRDAPSVFSTIEGSEALLRQLDEHDFLASGRLLAGGLVAAGEASAGGLLIGLDTVRDARVSGLYRHLAEGEWLDESEPQAVVLGSRLARTLAVAIGDELVVLSQATDGSMANDLYRVRGILRSISDATDRSGLFMTEAAFRNLFLVDDGSHQILVRRPRTLELEASTAEVKNLAPELDVLSWRQLVPTLASLLDSTQALMQIIFFIVYIAVAILLINAMLMAVFERIRELGVLKAIGVGPGRVLALMLMEGALQTAIAIAAGLLLSVPALLYLMRAGIRLGGLNVMGMAMDPVWRAAVTPTTVLGPVLALLVIVFASALYPALKAARLEPVEAMHYQ